jgi:hypothetical protein
MYRLAYHPLNVILFVMIEMLAPCMAAEPIRVGQPTGEAKLSLATSLRRGHDGHDYLVFHLRNIGDAPIQYYRTDLPWGESSCSALVIGIDTAEFRRLRESPRAIIEFGSVETIDNGKELTGEVCLARRMSDYEATVRKRDVIVFWAYKLWTFGGPPSKWFTGSMLIPPRESGKQ